MLRVAWCGSDRIPGPDVRKYDPLLGAGADVRLEALDNAPRSFTHVRGDVRSVGHLYGAVHERLTKEIDYWSDRFIKLTDDKNAGKDVRLNLENVRRTLSDLEARLESRKKELQSMRHVTSATPVALSGALVIPAGLLRALRGEPAAADSAFSNDPEARSRIEQIAMKAVRQVEEARGCRVVDVSAQKCGWDITAYAPIMDGRLPEARHIEVKGRIKGARDRFPAGYCHHVMERRDLPVCAGKRRGIRRVSMEQHHVRSDERRVVVTGLGVVSPYGHGCEVYWQGLAQGQCMIGPLTLFPTDGFRSCLAGELPAATVRALGTAQQSRATRFLLAAAQEAVGHAGLDSGALTTGT